MFVRAVLERVLEVFLVSHTHLFGLGVGILLDKLQPLSAAGDVIDGFQFVEVFLGDLAQRAGTLAAIVCAEPSINLVLVFEDPFEDRTGLGVIRI